MVLAASTLVLQTAKQVKVVISLMERIRQLPSRVTVDAVDLIQVMVSQLADIPVAVPPIQTRDMQLPPHQTLVQVEAQLMVVHLIFMAVAVAVAPVVLVILVRITVLVELV